MKQVHTLDRVVIRFAGDSGDGMQLTGDRFTADSAVFGNDISTLPNFPAEIRAPAGTLPGVSSFQLHFANYDIMTPGDRPDVLVAMNPAALKANIADLPRGGVVIADTADFTKRNLAKVGYAANPLEDDSLADYQVHALDLTGDDGGGGEAVRAEPQGRLAGQEHVRAGPALVALPPPHRGHAHLPDRASSPPSPTSATRTSPPSRPATPSARPPRSSPSATRWRPAPMPPGRYRQINGNTALALGLVTAARKADLPLFLGAYPITPASDVLHELSKHKRFGVTTFQAEDEIAGVGAALGASFAGHLGVTTSSGPGIALKAETIGLAVMTELPLVVIDVQRAGPSTGMPTKTEQSDLLQVMYGRNGEAPVPVLAAQSPSDCFDTAVEAVRIAVKYRTPVMLLSDGYIANGAEPWHVPDLSAIAPIDPQFATEANSTDAKGEPMFLPYLRDPETLARPWAKPGHRRAAAPDRRHREGQGHRRRLLRPGQPRPDGPHPAGQDRRHRPRHPRPRRRRPGRRRRPHRARPRAGLGFDLRPGHRGGPPGPQRRAGWSPRPTCATSTRSRATSARCCGATTASSCRR